MKSSMVSTLPAPVIYMAPNRPNVNSPTSPILETPLALPHPRFIPLYTHRHVRKHAHEALGPLDGLDLALDGDLGGGELVSCEAGGAECAEAESTVFEGGAFEGAALGVSIGC